MILAAQNGVQGALVSAVKDSTETNILDKRSAAENLVWLDNPIGPHPGRRLDNYSALLKKYRKKYLDCMITVQQLRDLRKLHSEFRNNFAHFAPMEWSIEAAGLPRMINAALDLIESAMQSRKIEIHLTGNMKRRLAENLLTIRDALAVL